MNFLKKVIFVGAVLCHSFIVSMESPHFAQAKVVGEYSEEYIKDLKDTLARKLYQELETFFLELRALHIEFEKERLNLEDKKLFLELQELLGIWGIIVTQYVTKEGAYEQIRSHLDNFSLPKLMRMQRKFFPVIPTRIRKKQ